MWSVNRKAHAEVESALDVAENALHQVKMRLPRCVHIQAHLLDCVCDIWTRMREILKCTGITPILCRISEKRSIVGRQLAFHINRCSTRIAVYHTSALKKVQSILTLREHHPC
jgi:hypothetical protein